MRPAFFALTAAGITVLVGLYLLFKPQPEALPPAQSPAMPTTVPAARPPAPLRFEIVLRQGQRVSGQELIQVRQGQQLTLAVTSDIADELHLHGYDLRLELKPNEPALLSFKAEHPGRFDYELHKAHQELGVIEVLPR